MSRPHIRASIDAAPSASHAALEGVERHVDRAAHTDIDFPRVEPLRRGA